MHFFEVNCMKSRFFFNSLRGNLFFYHSLLIVLILLLAGAFSYIIFSRSFEKTILQEQNSLGTALVSSVENELDKLNTVSMNISYSNLLKNLFREYQEYNNAGLPLVNNVSRYNDLSLLFDSIMAVMGPFHTVSQVNLYTFDGFMIGSGIYNEETQILLKDHRGLQEAITLDGLKYISAPRKIEYLGKSNLHLKDHVFISLIRVFKDHYHQNEGIVEVLQDCEDFFAYYDMLQSRNHLRIFLVDARGEVLYPYDGNDPVLQEEVSGKFMAGKLFPEKDNIYIKGSDGHDIYSVFPIEGYSMNLILLQSKSVLFASLHRFQVFFSDFPSFYYKLYGHYFIFCIFACHKAP